MTEATVLPNYRSFRNSDPPQILRLWEECGLGRGAAKGFTCDALEFVVFGQPYFDPRGLIVAHIQGKLVGFIHAGFGSNATETGISHEDGVICMVMVHPDFRRRGIARALVAEAERYLCESGATNITAGQMSKRDSFYLGLYGGSALPGFLETDPNAAPFFQALNYRPVERRLVFQRDIVSKQEPFDARMSGIRRSAKFLVTEQPERLTLWWVARCGRFDTFRFLVLPKNSGTALGEVSCFGLDLFTRAWQHRCVGFTDLCIDESVRRKGYAKALLLEAFRRLRDEMVTRVEMQTSESNIATIGLLKSLRFEHIDTGIVYQKA